MLKKTDILHDLRTARFGRTLYVFDTIDSTNATARKLADAGAPEGTLVVAEHQNAGRGRLGRDWIDARGENLLCSVILRPQLPLNRIPLLTFATAVATAEAVERYAGVAPECKWPNDLLLRGRKFCGILLESVSSGNRPTYAIVGIGINVNQTSFPDDLADRTTSLVQESGQPMDRLLLLRALLESLETWYELATRDDFSTVLDRWRSRTKMFGQSVIISTEQEQFSGIAVDLTDDGGLVVEDQGERRTVHAADVTLARFGRGD